MEKKDDEKKDKKKDEVEELGKVIFPFVAYGTESLPTQETVLIKNATVWTNESDGILQNTDLRFTLLVDANLLNAILTGADLSNAVLTGTILTGANLENAVLTNVILNCVGHPICIK